MGLFSRKKKPSSVKLPSSPNSFVSGLFTPPLSPNIQQSPVFEKPQLHLRVAVDPVLTEDNNHRGLFEISVDHEADLTILRAAILGRLGNVGINLFKVSIPVLAYRQAQEYHDKFSAPADLLTTFPAFNLDDPSQYVSSLGPTGWTGTPRELSSLSVHDWFPDSTPAETISILVRTAKQTHSTSPPYTFLAHFAPSELSPLSRAGPSRQCRRAPTVVCLSADSSVRDLKAELIKASGRTIEGEYLDKVVLWKVEMSEEEMIVIGERGGLKGGRMPWPYPPGGLVPLAMTESSLPVTHYFADYQSNSNMVSLSVWLPPSLTTSSDMSRADSTVPPMFKFPMDFSEASPPCRRVRARPSTAPAVVVHSTDTSPAISSVPAFGAPRPGVRPTTRMDLSAPDLSRRPRVASPLCSSTILPKHGLGINVPTSPPMTAPTSPEIPDERGSVSVSDGSSDEGVPALCFSQISLSSDPTDSSNGLKTPEAVLSDEKDDWLSPSSDNMKDLRKTGSLRVVSLGPWRSHKRDISNYPVM